MRVFRWFVARVRHFAGGAWLRPYRPESQEFMHHTRAVLQEFMFSLFGGAGAVVEETVALASLFGDCWQ